jgi:hypothetical protein
MVYLSEKHRHLSEQLNSWWRTQTTFKTKKEMAGALNVHHDTLGDYFSGRKFPRPDIENRIYELTNIQGLEPGVRSDSSSDDVDSTVKSEESPLRHPSDPTKGERFGERSVVISLQRTSCPFCMHDITRFRGCVYCGQEFVWANVPLEYGELK